MKKNFKVKNLDCAVCANKMEKLIKKIDGIVDCNINFLTCKVIIEAVDFNDEITEKVIKAIKKVDSSCELI